MPKTKEFNMLTEFIQYSTYQFFKAAKVYPLLFVEALIPRFKSNRELWEQPDERKVRAQRDEQDYLDDVNYIPTTTTTTTTETENPPQEENHNIIDDAMADYLFGAFDRRAEEEPSTENMDDGFNRRAEEEPLTENMDDGFDRREEKESSIEDMDAGFDSGVETNSEEVSKLLLEMGEETTLDVI